jgi:hypothetical protein
VDEQAQIIAGRYRVLDLIGSGGMGRVWLAWDERLSRAVAVKQLRSPLELPGDEARIATDRAIREGRITARLHHPHAVPIFDVVDHEGLPCLVMQYLPSRTLHEVLSTRGTLPPQEVAPIGSQIASALAAAHDQGIIHRDVKPGNILVTSDGTARITDFGISRVLGDITLTATGMVAGTPAYLAPEVARGGRAGPASDVFSLGATLYAAVEGGSPFGPADNPMAVLHRAASGAVAPPTQAGPLSSVLLPMLATAPDERPTMKECAQALAEVSGDGVPTGVPAALEARAAAPAATEVTAAEVTAAEVTAAEVAVPGVEAAALTAAGVEAAEEAAVVAADVHQASEHPSTARPSDDPETERIDRRTEVLPAAVPEEPAGGGPTAAELTGSGSDDPHPEHPGRRRGLPVVIALAFVASALFAVWVLARASDNPGEAGSAPTRVPTASASTTNATRPTSSSASTTTPPRTSTPARTTAAEPPAAQTTRAPATRPTANDLVNALSHYYALLPGNTDAGWQLLTDRYRSTTAGSRQQYQAFWDAIRDVRLGNAAADGPSYVVATLTYHMDDGRTFIERTSYSLVKDDGVLKIDRSAVLSSRQS